MKSICFIILLIGIIRSTGLSQTRWPPVYEIKSDTAFEQRINSDYLQVLQDKSGQWTIREILDKTLNNRFHSLTKKTADSVANTYWIRWKVKNSMPLEAGLSITTGADQSDYYLFINGLNAGHYVLGGRVPWSQKSGFKRANAIPFTLKPGQVLTVYQKRQSKVATQLPSTIWVSLLNTTQLAQTELKAYETGYLKKEFVYLNFLAGLFVLASILNFLIFFETKDKAQLYFSLFLFFFSLRYNTVFSEILARESILLSKAFDRIFEMSFVFFLYFVRHYFGIIHLYPRRDKFITVVTMVFIGVFSLGIIPELSDNFVYSKIVLTTGILFSITVIVTIILSLRKQGEQKRIFITALLPFILCFAFFALCLLYFDDSFRDQLDFMAELVIGISVAWAVIVFSAFLFKRYSRQEKKLLEEQLEKERVVSENERQLNELIARQKTELEKEVIQRTSELNRSLQELKSTQSRLIQKEKLASLGELTAGIAHEIQNPLNFVNNFSELSIELAQELQEEVNKPEIDKELLSDLVSDLTQNQEKINHHGKRVSNIVKGMLEHSRMGTGEPVATDLNKLVDEYLQLSYHGMRAKNKTDPAHRFQADFTLISDPNQPSVNVVPQEIGRVLLNLFNNAFYAVGERTKKETEAYRPQVKVVISHTDDTVTIRVQDNGAGISESVKAKIFQPFFTTKPTGEGTGLGLSLSYDIITKGHGGTLTAESTECIGSEFIITLPVV